MTRANVAWARAIFWSLNAKYRDHGLVVTVLDDRAVTRENLRRRGVTFPNMLDDSPKADEAIRGITASALYRSIT